MMIVIMLLGIDANQLNAVDIRLRRSCESSHDLLPQQSIADTLYDPRVPQCCLQVGYSTVMMNVG